MVNVISTSFLYSMKYLEHYITNNNYLTFLLIISSNEALDHNLQSKELNLTKNSTTLLREAHLS